MPKKKTGVWKICYCKTNFYVPNYLKDKRKFCSTNCANKANASKLSESRKGEGNPVFGKSPWNKGLIGVIKHPSTQGKNHYNWKGGKCKEEYKLRRSGKWKEWREKVFKRDNFICQICQQKKRELAPHHIKTFLRFKADRFKVENGVTLCKECHIKLHAKNRGKVIVPIN